LLRCWFADAERFGTDWFEFQFGDGDFFAARVLVLHPPTSLTLNWRFLGVGPTFDIQDQLTAVGDSTDVVVTDRGALTEDERRSLCDGWADFLERLDTFSTTGRWSVRVERGLRRRHRAAFVGGSAGSTHRPGVTPPDVRSR
jgi:uncharacterized protein YndB with AHSA1/START domain